MGHHIDIVFLTVCDETFAVIGASVVFERRITQGKLLGPMACGKTADEATEENEHDGAAQNLIVHELYFRRCAYGHNGKSTGGMCIGQTEHKPHAVTTLAHGPCHYCRGQPLGQGSRQHHHDDNPEGFGVSDKDAEVDYHTYAYQEIWDEQGIAYKFKACHQRTRLRNESVDYQTGKERTEQAFQSHQFGKRCAEEDEQKYKYILHDTVVVAAHEPTAYTGKDKDDEGDV